MRELTVLERDRINGDTRLLGLIGDGLSHSLSPLLHNYAARSLGINVVYVPISLPATAVSGFLEAALSFGAQGFNVTMPHKNLVASLMPASGLRSVNTLYRGSDEWVATSTDAEGFERGLFRLGKDLASFRRIVVLGSGGAAAAVIEHLVSKRFKPEVVVLRRSSNHDAVLAQIGSALIDISFAALNPETLTKTLGGAGPETLLIQATSAPLRGNNLREFVPALDKFRGVTVDLVYGKPSALYFAARDRGLMAQDGEPMLIEQARLAQELWWGKAAAYEQLAAALKASNV